MQNLVYEWVDFSKFGQIWAKIGSNLRKFSKKLVILFKIVPIGIWMGYFFLKNWYLYGSTLKFHGGTPRGYICLILVKNAFFSPTSFEIVGYG